MRYNTSTVRTLLLATLLLALAATTAFAATDDTRYDSDYDETARVARISLLSGDVSLQRAGSRKWEHATLNFPLVEGDRIATGAGAHAELQIDARNFVRLGEYTTLDIVSLRAEGIALSLPEGTATLRLARFAPDTEYFEIDAPKTTIAAEERGLYRLDVAQNGNVRVTARNGARARIYSDTSGFTLRDNRTAELVYDASGEGDWSFTAARDFDNWDRWNDDRERYLAERLRYDNRDRYYDDSIWGAEELDLYGDWVSTRDYGYVWRPRTTIINNYYDWAPYRYGHWVWFPPYGWTWVGDEPWGWAPYHYGRWVYHENYWCWAPRGYYNYNRRSWWRPALVAFVFSNNNDVCWYPLGYRQHDPHSRSYGNRDRDRVKLLGNSAGVNEPPLDRAIYQRAVSSLPAREFGMMKARPRSAPTTLALDAVKKEPLRGRLPIKPNDDASVGTGNSSNSNGAIAARPRIGADVKSHPSDPNRRLPERQTGAAVRVPGKSLDAELKNERIFKNRTPRVGTTDATSGATDNTDARPTGAVTRPFPGRMPKTDVTSDTGEPKLTRPPKSTRTGDDDTRPRDPGFNKNSESKRPVERTNDNGDSGNQAQPAPVERTAPKYERPEPKYERPEPKRERVEPKVERPEPRYERPEPKYERPEPKYERPAPPPREERHDPPPQREERHEAPPPREERRESPPPPREEKRSDPSPERDSPAKSRKDPPR